MEILEEVYRVFDIEIEQLRRVKESLDDSIIKVIEEISKCEGKVILSGMGKPGHIVKKISATLSSLGTPSYVLNPGEAMHGDLGTISNRDIVFFISNSGETFEVCSILSNIKIIGATIVAITSNENSTLAQYADYLILLPVMKEACNLNLAPTSSTTAALVVGDAISVAVSKLNHFEKENFALFHPAGALGRKLITKVKDIMAKGERLPIVQLGSTMTDAIVEMCKDGLGAVMIVNNEGNINGLITDGDLKRYLKKGGEIHNEIVDNIMTKTPICVNQEELAVNALNLMENGERVFSVLPVIDDNNKAIGLVRNHDIIKMGIFI